MLYFSFKIRVRRSFFTQYEPGTQLHALGAQAEDSVHLPARYNSTGSNHRYFHCSSHGRDQHQGGGLLPTVMPPGLKTFHHHGITPGGFGLLSKFAAADHMDNGNAFLL